MATMPQGEEQKSGEGAAPFEPHIVAFCCTF